jgi:hypothetical protein
MWNQIKILQGRWYYSSVGGAEYRGFKTERRLGYQNSNQVFGWVRHYVMLRDQLAATAPSNTNGTWQVLRFRKIWIEFKSGNYQCCTVGTSWGVNQRVNGVANRSEPAGRCVICGARWATKDLQTLSRPFPTIERACWPATIWTLSAPDQHYIRSMLLEYTPWDTMSSGLPTAITLMLQHSRWCITDSN